MRTASHGSIEDADGELGRAAPRRREPAPLERRGTSTSGVRTTAQSFIGRICSMQSINFVLTNWIPRRSATRLMARLSRIEQPLVRDASMWVWQFFGGDLQLHEAK